MILFPGLNMDEIKIGIIVAAPKKIKTAVSRIADTTSTPLR